MLTKEDLNQIGALLDERFEKQDAKIDERFEKQDSRIDSLERKIEEQKNWMSVKFHEQGETMEARFAEQTVYINNAVARLRSEMTEEMEKMDRKIEKLDRKIDDKFYEQQLWLENRYDPYIKMAMEYLPTAPKTYEQLDTRTSEAEIKIVDLRRMARDHEERIRCLEVREG